VNDDFLDKSLRETVLGKGVLQLVPEFAHLKKDFVKYLL